MEESNVNRLNGVPNFGHGFEEEVIAEAEEILAEVEEAPKKKGKKSE